MSDTTIILQQLIEDAKRDLVGYCENQCLTANCEECKIADLIETIRQAEEKL